MKRCTWNDKGSRCEAEGIVSHVSQDGEIWACLCQGHSDDWDSARTAYSKEGDFKRMMSSYVKAAGGPAQLAKRM